MTPFMGRADLVAHVRQELRLEPGCLQRSLPGVDQFIEGPPKLLFVPQQRLDEDGVIGKRRVQLPIGRTIDPIGTRDPCRDSRLYRADLGPPEGDAELPFGLAKVPAEAFDLPEELFDLRSIDAHGDQSPGAKCPSNGCRLILRMEVTPRHRGTMADGPATRKVRGR